VNKGQAFLALMLFIGGLILATGIALAYITISSVNAGYGFQASQNAEAVAIAGVEDALLQIDRNNTFSYASPGYALSLPAGTATVIVQQSMPSANFVTITSSGVVSGRHRTIQVVLSENSVTGQTTLTKWQDVQ